MDKDIGCHHGLVKYAMATPPATEYFKRYLFTKSVSKAGGLFLKTKYKTMKRKTFVYQDATCEWRWHIKSRGKVIADSAESYKKFAHCVKMAKSFGYPTFLLNGNGKPILQ